MASYPKVIKRELLRINKEWYKGGIPDYLPFFRGDEEGFLHVHVETPPGLFEQGE